MRRYSLIALTFLVAMFVGTATSQAVVVDMNDLGHASIAYNPNDQSGYIGAALTPGTCGDLFSTGGCASLANVGVPLVTSSAPCLDPSLSPDLWVFGQNDRLPNAGLCYHGGPVLHQNETFALTWEAPDPSSGTRQNWPLTWKYVEQFLRDVADGSGSLSSPYALTTQYSDANGRAQNSSKFGGGCIDNGLTAGSQCEFASPPTGHGYPASGCTPTGASFITSSTTTPNTVCLTDSQLQAEVATMVGQTGILSRRQPGYSPTVVLLTPPGVESCLDPTGKLCSANGSINPARASVSSDTTAGTIPSGTYSVEVSYVTAGGESLPSASTAVVTTGPGSEITISAPQPSPGATGWYAYVPSGPGSSYVRQQSSPTPIGTNLTLQALQTSGAPPLPGICSYHSQVQVDGTEVTYVVQPWTGLTGCDEPDAPAIPNNPPPSVLQTDMGIRLVSPLSQSHIAAIVDPTMNSWFALDGAEVNDHGGCTPLGGGVDSVTVGSSSQNPYLLQPEFNNAGVIETDPNTYFGCAPNVILSPAFVVPSSINQGEEVELDGSTTASTLIVPKSGYAWDFGDGTTATGPSVVHTYAKGGTYTIKLTVTDRGGNEESLSQAISVLDQNGMPVVETTSNSSSGGSGGPGGGASVPALQVRLLLMPQGLRTALKSGIAARVSTNQPVDGFAYVSITRAAARRAGIKAGQGPSVYIGRGTVKRINSGSVILHLHLSGSVAKKLKKLRHVTLTVHLSLVSATGNRFAVAAAAHY